MAVIAENQSASRDMEETPKPAAAGAVAAVPASYWACISEAQKSPLAVRVLAGSVGSIITALVVTPLEVAKIRAQISFPTVGDHSSTGLPRIPPALGADGANKIKRARMITAPVCPKGCMVLFNGHMDCFVTKESFPSAFDAPNSPGKVATATTAAVPRSSTGVFSILRKIFVQEGFTGIYAGLRPTLFMAVPNTVLYFSAYEELIWRLRHNAIAGDDDDDDVQLLPSSAWYYPLIAGGVARTVASSVTAPFEFIRTRQAANGGGGRATTMWAELQAIVQTDGRGMSALYQGLRPTLWRDVPFSAIYWFCIEELRAIWKERRSASTILFSPMEQAGQEFANGALSGMIAAAVTTPFDVVKTRQQTASVTIPTNQPQSFPSHVLCSMDGLSTGGGQSKSISGGGTFHIMRQIVAQEGWTSLWRGNQARMLKVAPSCAIMISSYEFGKRIL